MSDTNQKDLVLSINEYAYVLDETKGHVSCLVGPTKMSLSQSDKLVRFNETSKAFEPCPFERSKYLFTIIPEGWYGILKNPVKDNKHPQRGTSNTLPEEMLVGQKINVRGPASFALYPGQMAKVIRGHALRSNQYLLARVYEAETANNSQGEVRDAEGNLIERTEKYTNGQILVIKGTEVSFYIPPTGIEVIPVENDARKGYVREAVTLERLEYTILKDENGSKTYRHGPDVVFPEPTESFVTSPRGGYVFRAIELSKISGIYVKVIAEYKDENETIHPVGEELFITGDQQMIYYPRPEHAIISYDDKILHHAIAIPEGEGRYVMDRLTGVISTVRGPLMFLPDPRTQVIVKRKLSPRQCNLWYPGNNDVLTYNVALNEKAVEKQNKKSVSVDTAFSMYNDSISSTTATALRGLPTTFALSGDSAEGANAAITNLSNSLAALESNASISRGTSYTKPRTITLDNAFDGVVAINVWSGYAVNVISKDGRREVICGPQTVLLDYDQTLGEVIDRQTGRPTVYLKLDDEMRESTFEFETKDLINGEFTISYSFGFSPSHRNNWFDIDNYAVYLNNILKTKIHDEIKKYTIEDFYHSYHEIVSEIVVSAENTVIVPNGIYVKDCLVSGFTVEGQIAKLIDKYHSNLLEQSFRLKEAEARVVVAEQLAVAQQKEAEVRNAELLNDLELQRQEAATKLEIQRNIDEQKMAAKMAEKEAERDLQYVINAIQDAALERDRKQKDQDIAYKNQLANIEKAKQEAYADTVTKILTAVSPDLVAAMTSKSNADVTIAIAEALAPYALAGDSETVGDVVNKITRGLPLEDAIKNIQANKA